jgi:hypothetical protein
MEARVEEAAIERILATLSPNDYGWRRQLPIEFFGQPVSLRIETRPNPGKEPPPPPTPREIELAHSILSNFGCLLAECDRQYRDYNADFPELFGKVHEPRVWICREFLGEAPPGAWAFVTGISDAPDWAIQMEFSGLEFQGTWSGD